jgi:hypothetical protein
MIDTADGSSLMHEILDQYTGAFFALKLRNNVITSPYAANVDNQISSFLNIPKTQEGVQAFQLWNVSEAARQFAIRKIATGFVDATSVQNDILFANLQSQLITSPNMASQYINLLVCCVEEYIKQKKFDAVQKFLQQYMIRIDLVYSNVEAFVLPWKLLFIKEEPLVDQTPAQNDQISEIKHNPFRKNPLPHEEIRQFRGLAVLSSSIAYARFGFKQYRNEYVAENGGPFSEYSEDEIESGLSSSIERSSASDGQNKPNNDAHEYLKYICAAVSLHVKGHAFQSANDVALRLWTFVVNEWFTPLKFAEMYDSLKNELVSCLDGLVTLFELQSAKIQNDIEVMAIPEELNDSESKSDSLPVDFIHPKDVKYNMYVARDLISFLIKILCFLGKHEDIVNIGLRLIQTYIMHAPEYAYSVCSASMVSLIFAQEKIIANCVDDVTSMENALTSFQTDWEETQAKKRKKKLRIARAEKSEEEIQYDIERGILEEKLNEAKSTLEMNCGKKEFLLAIEKRVDGIFTTGQQLFEKARKNMKAFVLECRVQINDLSNSGRKSAFEDLLKSKPNLFKFEEIMGYFNQVSSVLREKKERRVLLSALNEQGDFCLLFNQRDRARNAWRDAVDGIFNVLDAWKNWHPVVSEALQTLPQDITLGAIPTIVVLGKLAKYCSENDMDQKSSYCQMAATLCRIPFMESIGHPTDVAGFAAYNCTNLGGPSAMEFISDTFSAYSFQSALDTIIDVLGNEKQQLLALPVIVLLEHFYGYYSQRVENWLFCRIKRIKYLIDLRMFSEATSMLNSIITTIRAIQGGVFSNPLLWPNDLECVATDSSSNGIDFYNKPPFFNNLPPDCELNQTALNWVFNFPDYFSTTTAKDVVYLPVKPKTAEELAAEEALRVAREEAAAKNTKGKGKSAPPPDLKPAEPALLSRPLFNVYHHAEILSVCSHFLMEIATLDNRISVPHRKFIEATSTQAETLFTKSLNLIVPSSDNANTAKDDLCIPSFSNAKWVNLFGRCRVLHLQNLLLKRNFKSVRCNILSIVNLLSTLPAQIASGEAKNDITHLWFTLKYMLCQTAELQARHKDVLVLATQCATESSMVCSGYWVRLFISLKAFANYKLGDLSDCEVNCTNVINSYETSKISDINLVLCYLQLATVIQAKSLNIPVQKSIRCLFDAYQAIQKAKRVAIRLCEERGFVGGDCNATFVSNNCGVTKHDQFPPHLHSVTHIHVNYPVLLTKYHVATQGKKDSQKLSNNEANSCFPNSHLRLGPVDANTEYAKSDYISIYLREVRVLATCLNSVCILVDEIRSANIEQNMCDIECDDSDVEIKSGTLLQEQIHAGEDGLKVTTRNTN